MIGENAEYMLLEDTLDVVGTVENGGYKKKKCRNISVDRSKTFRMKNLPVFTEERFGWKLERRDPNERCCVPTVLWKRDFWKAVLWCTENPAEDQRMAG